MFNLNPAEVSMFSLRHAGRLFGVAACCVLLSACGGGGGDDGGGGSSSSSSSSSGSSSSSSSSSSGGDQGGQKTVQTLSFGTLPDLVVGENSAVAASASSGLPIAYASTTPSVCSIDASTGAVTPLTSGTCTIVATQAGNEQYAAAELTQSIEVKSGIKQQTITFSNAPTLTLRGVATVTATSTSGLPVSYSSVTPSVCTVVAASGAVTDLTDGTCTIAADQPGNASYAPAPQVTQSIVVAKSRVQTINFGAAPTLTVGKTATVKATASSGLAVSYGSKTASICTVDAASGVVTGVAAGSCTITADQAGNADYDAAAQAAQTFTVEAAPLTKARYNVTATWFEPDTNPRHSIFVGSFDYDPATKTVTNLKGILSESMTGDPARPYKASAGPGNYAGGGDSMTWLGLDNTSNATWGATQSYQGTTYTYDEIRALHTKYNIAGPAPTGGLNNQLVPSWHDDKLGGTFAVTFRNSTTLTCTNVAGGDGWSPQSCADNGGVYAGFPKLANNPGNAYAYIFIPDSIVNNTTTTLNWNEATSTGDLGVAYMAYADFVPTVHPQGPYDFGGGMMGAVGMTGWSKTAYGAVGTMSGYPLSVVFTKQ